MADNKKGDFTFKWTMEYSKEGKTPICTTAVLVLPDVRIKELPGWIAKFRISFTNLLYDIYNDEREYLATYNIGDKMVHIRFNQFKDRGNDIGAGSTFEFKSIQKAMLWVFLKTQKEK